MKSLIFAAFLILGIAPAQAAVLDSFALPTNGGTVNSTAVLTAYTGDSDHLVWFYSIT